MKIVVYGAGISGLTTAYTLTKKCKDAEIILVEKTDRVGGHIQTIEKEGFLFERGPRGFLSSGKGKNTLALVKELGIEKSLVAIERKERYLWYNQKLQPLTPFFLLRLGFFQKALKECFLSPNPREESIGEFFLRRFGQKITDVLIDPLVTGIFGGNLWELSVNACWPHLKVWEERYGSVIKGYVKHREKGKLCSFKHGMETLPQALFAYLKERIEIRFSSVFCEGDVSIYAIPHNRIHYNTLTTVNLGWKKKVVKPKGFGYLIPSKENEDILGVVFDSEHKLCVMLQGEVVNPLDTATCAIRRHLAIDSLPDSVDIHTARSAIPQYLVGVKGSSDPLYVRGIGINDCITNAMHLDHLMFYKDSN